MDFSSLRDRNWVKVLERSLPFIAGFALVAVGAIFFAKSFYYVNNSAEARKASSSTVRRLNKQLADIRARIDARGKAPLDTTKPSPLGPIKKTSAPPHVEDFDRTQYLEKTAIARSPSEVIELQKRGERDYEVFQVSPSKRFRRVGPIRVSVRKIDAARQTYDVALQVNGSRIEKHNVKRQERIAVPAGGRELVEVVINQISDDRVTGYVSVPRSEGRSLSIS